jgi:aminoglycoside phosphotransferase (APT) family kinase protein
MKLPYLEGIDTALHQVTSEGEDFVLCHNDLGQHNVLVDPDALKITAILYWEYAGFYPLEFEARFWLRSGTSAALEWLNEVDDCDALLKKLRDLGVSKDTGSGGEA